MAREYNYSCLLLTEMYFTKESLGWWINVSDTITMQRTPELALSSVMEKQ